MAAQGPIIKSFGTFSITNHQGQSKLTLSAALESEPFDISPGSEVKVEQINPDEERAFLRLTPVEE